MKSSKFIILLIVAMALSSCSTIRFGRTTTVTIETEHPGDIVDIIAVGPKKVEDIQKVTLPYKYKVKHNNLPQRLDIVSNNYIYGPFTIGAVKKGELIGNISKVAGWSTILAEWGLMGGIGLACGSSEIALIGFGAGVAIGGPLLAIGYTAETDIPNSKFYLTTSTPIDSTNMYKLKGWYLRQRALDDIYTLLSQGDYKLSKAKSSFLLDIKPTAELYYLRGISSYYLGDHKDALNDLNESFYRLNAEINPGLKDEVIECISAVEQSIAIKKEKRNQMWAEIAGTVLQAGVEAYSMYQQAEATKYNQNHGMSPSGVVIDPTKLSQTHLNQLADPNFAMQQVFSQEMQDYQQFTRYNKKPDGSNYTLTEYRTLQGAAIQYAKENGYDIIAEQRRQMEEDRKWQKEQRQKDKERWFANYGYTLESSTSTPSASNNSASELNNKSDSSQSSTTQTANNNLSTQNQQSSTDDNENDKQELDSKQQYKSDPVSSEDYHRIKSIDLYYRDGDTARKMITNVDLCKKGGYIYVKIGNKYYPRTSPNWSKFRNAILYGHTQLYYND